MKRIIFLLVFVVGVFKSYAQEQINVGINGGLTIGSTEVPTDFGFGADANYLFDLFSGLHQRQLLMYSTRPQQLMQLTSSMILWLK